MDMYLSFSFSVIPLYFSQWSIIARNEEKK